MTKTASRRLVPIQPNLREWLLAPKGNDNAPVWNGTPWGFIRDVSATCEAAGVPRIENGTRHSFVTYRVASTGDVPRIALEAGNPAQMIFRHYRGLATADSGAKYFNIRPVATDEVMVPFAR